MKKENILIVDDEEIIRRTLEIMLSKQGYTVFTASDFDGALDIINVDKPDLILSDIVLGGRSGLEILTEVKNRELSCPVVLFTGHPNIETATEAVRLGAYDYILKPVKKESLLRITKMALRHKEVIDERNEYRDNLEAIFNSANEGIITTDKDLKVIEINEAASKICSLASGKSVSKPLASLMKERRCGCLDLLKKTINEKVSVNKVKIECQRKDNFKQFVSIKTSPLINRHREFKGVVMLISDETRIINLEQAVNERYCFSNIIGKSSKMQDMYFMIKELTNVDTTVLIEGESGTGKELVAEALHCKGNRGNGPYIKVNCSAFSENLLESELFGHVKGSFTGAVSDKKGRFQLADGGTILLDEIGDISPSIQVKLLRVIQEKEIERVGGTAPVKVDVRIAAATNQDLRKKIEEGSFREDLFYRLKVVEIHIPPLRERKEDIHLLTEHFITKFNQKFHKDIIAVSEEVYKIFNDYQWRGNVRELEHTLEHAFITCHQSTITIDNLPHDFMSKGQRNVSTNRDNEHTTIMEALEKNRWNKSEAARELGMTRTTFYNKLKKYEIT